MLSKIQFVMGFVVVVVVYLGVYFVVGSQRDFRYILFLLKEIHFKMEIGYLNIQDVAIFLKVKGLTL